MRTLSLFFVAALGLIPYGQGKSQVCDIKELDDCAATMVIMGKKDTVVPKNKAEVLEMCNVVKDSVKCIRNYTQRCLDPLRRQLINMYAASGGRIRKQYCESQEGIDEILEYLPCMSKTLELLNPCMERVIKEFEEIGKATQKDRIGMMCCRFADYRGCVLNATEVHCSDDAIKRADEFIKIAVGDFMDIVCVGYEPDSEACTAFPRPDVEGREALSVSVVPPVLKILEDFI